MNISKAKLPPELEAALVKARAAFERMTPEERKAMYEAQRESWVRGESGWPDTRITAMAALSYDL